MFRTFNMGIGMVVICSEEEKKTLKDSLDNCFEIGRVVQGNRQTIVR
jgi:phosphoribosylaminoimidazole (AIR) synthetase